MRNLLAWLADLVLGPACPIGCGYRARGWRTLAWHCDYDHPGEATR
ncbi:hypothetical protein [Nocardioides sp.]|nr:hypothetical protein [Nocardioides sp.]MDI6911461.1 hypothetical protein [Nocardioides sp.]